MPTYRFTINGLRHHDFAGRLDELFRQAPGQRLTLSVEPDNPEEADAVIVYWGRRCVGYVRSAQRAMACALIRGQGREVLHGRVVEVDSQHRWLMVDVTAACSMQPSAGTRCTHLLSDWSFEGRTLPVEEAEHRLHAMLESMQMVLEQCEPWEEDVEEWLEYVEQELWRDISRETSELTEHLLLLLTGGATRQPAYADKALRLQLAIERMGSPEVRRRQVRHIVEQARSARMDRLLCHYGPDAADALLQLPGELARLFLSDGELLMGRLWYLHLPRRQVRALWTLLAMLVRLQGVSAVPMKNADDAEGNINRRDGICSAPAHEVDASTGGSVPPCSSEDAVRIAKGCKTKVLVILNAIYRAGWLRDVHDRPLTNRDKALNDILQRAFGEEKPTQIGCTIFPARDPDHAEKHRAAIQELLRHLPEEKE